MKEILINSEFAGADGKKSLYDYSVPDNCNNKLIIFIHGYMGYKDWGCWNLVSDYFTQKGYAFLKYNASHNGGTLQNPIDFDDLNSFSKNNYSKEIEDFESVLSLALLSNSNFDHVYIIGHSRGGAIALLQSKNSRINKICTWASVSYIEDRFPDGQDLINWKTNGFYYRENGRTKQKMPHEYSQYLDFMNNRDRLNIKEYCETSNIPICAIHGDNDSSVSIQEGRNIARWTNSDLITIQDTQHTFDSSQPWKLDSLPRALKEVCEKTHEFFRED